MQHKWDLSHPLKVSLGSVLGMKEAAKSALKWNTKRACYIVYYVFCIIQVFHKTANKEDFSHKKKQNNRNSLLNSQGVELLLHFTPWYKN